MIKYLLATAALVVAGMPAALGSASNGSFSRDVPVRVPQQARTTALPTTHHDRADVPHHAKADDDHGDDHGGTPEHEGRADDGSGHH